MCVFVDASSAQTLQIYVRICVCCDAYEHTGLFVTAAMRDFISALAHLRKLNFFHGLLILCD